MTATKCPHCEGVGSNPVNLPAYERDPQAQREVIDPCGPCEGTGEIEDE